MLEVLATCAILLGGMVCESDAGCIQVRVCEPVKCQQVCKYVAAATGMIPYGPGWMGRAAGVGAGFGTDYVCELVCDHVQNCYYKEECKENNYYGKHG